MKKIASIVISFLIVILGFSLFFIFYLGNDFYHEYHFFVPKNTIERRLYDNRGGFATDGITLLSYRFNKKGKDKFIKYILDSDDWCRLPLDKDLYTILYGGGYYECVNKVSMPKVKNGYWHYKKYRNGDYLNCNFFSLSIYDLDNEALYLLKVKI